MVRYFSFQRRVLGWDGWSNGVSIGVTVSMSIAVSVRGNDKKIRGKGIEMEYSRPGSWGKVQKCLRPNRHG